MQIGNKIFPYPILNNNIDFSSYKNSSFSFEFDLGSDSNFIEIGRMLILKNARFNLVNDDLMELYKRDKLKCALVVECSGSIYRESFEIFNVPKDIQISKDNLNGKVVLSIYLYANENIDNFRNKDFIEDFEEYAFQIEKYDIVAVDDGFSVTIVVDENLDNKVDSIFTIIKDDSNIEQISFTSDYKQIIIKVSSEIMNIYEFLRSSEESSTVFYSMVVVPVLSSALEELQKYVSVTENEVSTIADLMDYKAWFRTIAEKYKLINGRELELEEFLEMNCFEESQRLLGSVMVNGIKSYYNILSNNLSDGNEGEEYE